jgi:hypothetical protein
MVSFPCFTSMFRHVAARIAPAAFRGCYVPSGRRVGSKARGLSTASMCTSFLINDLGGMHQGGEGVGGSCHACKALKNVCLS